MRMNLSPPVLQQSRNGTTGSAELGGRDEQRLRRRDELQRVFGGVIGEALSDPMVTEVMVNPDGAVYVDRLFAGMTEEPIARLKPRDVLNAIITVAGELGTIIDEANPSLQGELPLDGSRLQAWIPPAVRAPTLVIRKHRRQGIDGVPALRIADYIRDKTIPPNFAALLHQAVIDRRNVIIVGATSSGKTTFGGAFLDLVSELTPCDRIVTIEDTYELYCKSKNWVPLHSSETLSMRTLVKQTLRARPDRIVIGEVRDEAAHDVMMAWGTGHSGGLCTIHAQGVVDAFDRIEMLVQLSNYPVVPKTIAKAVHLVVALVREPGGPRRVTEMTYVHGWKGGEYQLEFVEPEW